MELLGTNFTIALGAWRLRFVLMLEEGDEPSSVRAPHAVPHHLTGSQKHAGV
ncbi:MAG TPA: hypothetical protein VFA29_15060 [Candidatus Baltobacteraceae bacterium]|nr:hypothetical protein [Candidatus Baltobacteraceae bacterium]